MWRIKLLAHRLYWNKDKELGIGVVPVKNPWPRALPSIKIRANFFSMIPGGMGIMEKMKEVCGGGWKRCYL
jgi:hypothetical protein